MDPTRNFPKDITQNNGEVNEQGSYSTMNDADVSDFCFEHEEYPSLKIIKVETMVDDIKQEEIVEEETDFEFFGADEDLDIDDKGPLQINLQYNIF